MASRSQWLAALAGLALLGLWLLLGREPGAVRPEGAAPPVGASDDRRPETRETLELGAPGPVGAAAERALASASTEPAADAGQEADLGPGLCRLRGRLVDGQGRPLAGQVVVLYALGTWPEATGTQPIAASRGLPGFETRSDAEGAFRFEFPRPPSAPT